MKRTTKDQRGATDDRDEARAPTADEPTAEPAAPAAPEPTAAEPAAAEWVPRSRLLRWSKNPRRNDSTVPEVARSIVRFGWGAPMVVRRDDGRVLAGHTREAAAALLADLWAKATSRERQTWHPDAVRVATTGEVVVRFVDLDEHDSDLYTLADNKIAERSSWDDGLLAEVVAALNDDGIDLTLGTGFADSEIKKILDGESAGTGDPGGTGGDPGDGRYKEQYGVIVICADEAEQERVFEQLKGEGFSCRVVVT